MMLRWITDDSSPTTTLAPNPPQYQWIKVQSLSQWNSFTQGDPNQYTASGSANNGFGDGGMPIVNGQSSSGSHLIRFDSSSGIINYDVWVNADASIVGGGNPAWVTGNVTTTMAADTRGVTLTRPGAIGEIMDADGTVHGDTIYSYTELLSDGDVGSATMDHINWQTFNPVFIGAWSKKAGTNDPNISWSWNPNDSRDTWNTGMWSMPFGSVTSLNGRFGGKPSGVITRTMVYNATDLNDGAQAEARYVLAIHDPCEEATHYEKRIKIFRGVVPDTLPLENKGSEPISTKGHEQIQKGDSWSVGVSINKDAPIIGVLLGALGLDANFSHSWSYSVTFEPLEITVPPGYYTVMHAYDAVINHSGTSRNYSPAGFTGITDFDFNVPDNPSGTIIWSPAYPIGTPIPNE